MVVMATSSDGAQPGIRETVTAIIADVILLFRGHVELAKAELKGSAKSLGLAIAAFSIALAMVNLAVILGFIAAVYGLSTAGIPLWACFLIVAGSLLVLCLVMLGLGVTMIRRAGRVKRSIAELDATIEAIRGGKRPR
jgi:uncharacterized membrane protein YqjE